VVVKCGSVLFQCAKDRSYCKAYILMVMVYCFIWLSQQAQSLQKAIALTSKPTTIVNIRANENTVT